tara:strand:- start:516 stop:833 length:318 start_codon:yes stop_codon:yes gene_type:complete
MKYVGLSEGNVVISTIIPKSERIDENRTFLGEGYIEVEETHDSDELLYYKYDSTAEADGIKTAASFTSPGLDSSGKDRWFDTTNGKLMQNTYSEGGAITGSEEVT